MKSKLKAKQIDCLGMGIMPMDLLFNVRQFPKAGSKIDGSGLMMQGGGPVPNLLVGLSRLGYRTALITAVGDDLIGELGLEELKQEQVDIRYVVQKRGRSDMAVGLIEEGSGRRTMVLNREIKMNATDLRLQEYPCPTVLHLDGRDMPAAMKLARWGQRVGAIIVFDIGSMRNDVSDIFGLVDHLVIADSYALPFTGMRSARKAIKHLRKFCPGTIVVTEGIKGTTGFEAEQFVTQPAFPVHAIDTTGAGDAFHVGYIHGLLQGDSLAERLHLGAAVAACNCLHAGARGGLPTLNRMKQFVRNRKRTDG